MRNKVMIYAATGLASIAAAATIGLTSASASPVPAHAPAKVTGSSVISVPGGLKTANPDKPGVAAGCADEAPAVPQGSVTGSSVISVPGGLKTANPDKPGVAAGCDDEAPGNAK
ncbi:hypothetical protein OG819_00175 [Streptomyces sp. NBC_01549]|uniref:hypothetical protein n=1 Tax=Streptomyces sp. NBC_01549 TaxID=2975874 RepID=UPI00225B9940|nr:hypothetical protein [Streptomyces sp. NBC_01549]MCX4588222.1 hypothetical protein [Streptomyces sp. NBC_01549]